MPEPSADQPPLEAIAALATAIRAALAPVPDAADVVGLAYAAEPASVRTLGSLGGWVARAGVDTDARQAATDLLVHHVIGSVAVEHNDRLVRGLDGNHAGRSAADVATSFEVGLGIILRGLATVR